MLIYIQQVYGSKVAIKNFLKNRFVFLKIKANLKKKLSVVYGRDPDEIGKHCRHLGVA